MFYQDLFRSKHRSLLHFSWWKHGNLSNMLIDHEMCVQFVGDRSSPACGNYTLQKDTYRWKSRVGENAVEILRNNFYVDDITKLLSDEKQAIKPTEC